MTSTRIRYAARLVNSSPLRLGSMSRSLTGLRFNSTAPSASGASSAAGSGTSGTAPPPPPPPPGPGPSKSNSTGVILTALAFVAGGLAYYQYGYHPGSAKTAETATFEDYQKVYNAIAKKLVDEDDYDDGSYAPLLVRLAWHASGTFDKNAKNGGSHAGTMRFKEEYDNNSNKGLATGKEFLEPIKQQFPWISYGDLYTLGGVTAIQEVQGPIIKWRPGRVDGDKSLVLPDSRLPAGSKGADHVRDVFTRLGFNDQETVALIGAHALGRCHVQNSGFDGPWTFSPTVFTNEFFKLLANEKWHIRKWDGPRQYQDDATNSLMMLPADYALVQDKSFKKWVVKYAEDSDLFFKDFASAFSRLLELGVKFDPNTPYFEFKPSE